MRGEIGRADADLGKVADARRLQAQALAYYVAKFPPDNPGVLEQRVSFGWLLLRQHAPVEAQAQFREVLARASDRPLFSVALALAGTAQLAIGRGDNDEALDASGRALDTFDHVVGFRDMRIGPELDLVRARALRLSGRVDEARDFAKRALESAVRFDVPTSPLIRHAQEELRISSSGAVTQP